MFRPAVAVFALIAGACVHAPSDDPAKPAEPAPMIVGGYGPADLANPDVKAAEKLAIDEIYRREPQRSLVENVTREQQVVAGMNYRFSVKMTGQNAYRITVYRPLQGEMSVTLFEKTTTLILERVVIGLSHTKAGPARTRPSKQDEPRPPPVVPDGSRSRAGRWSGYASA